MNVNYNMETHYNFIELYNSHIYQRYNDLYKDKKRMNDISNYELSKIFEWFSCIKHQ